LNGWKSGKRKEDGNGGNTLITFLGKDDERREREWSDGVNKEGGRCCSVLCEFINCTDSRQRKTVITSWRWDTDELFLSFMMFF